MIAWQSVAGLLSCVRLVFSKFGNYLTLDLKDLLIHVLSCLGLQREKGDLLHDVLSSVLLISHCDRLKGARTS